MTRHELRLELETRFRPLRPASTPRLILAGVFGPLAWAICVLLAVFLVHPTHEIVEGALVTVAAFLLAGAILTLLRWGRIREERRHVDRA